MSRIPSKIWINEHQFVEVAKGGSFTGLLQEIAVRKNATAFNKLNLALPDPDSILKKQGKDISLYRELMTDAHVWAGVQSRKSGVLSKNWDIDRGKSLSRNARFIESIFNNLDMDKIISEILNAPLFGFQPLEVLWKIEGSQVIPSDVVAKPPEWFKFDSSNKLRYAPPFINGKANTNTLGDQLPPFKFLLPQYNPRYDNPYGERVLARCFWPVTFKKGGLKFWVTRAEKFGMPHLVGKHPRGIGAEEIDALLDMLELMIQDAVAAVPDDSTVELLETKQTSGATDVYSELIEHCNAEISKAILGQTLTTEIGDTGSFAASNTHMGVRSDIVEMDRRLVEATLNELIDWIVFINFGSVDNRPRFILWEEEDVDKTQAERDEILSRTGLKFTLEYYRKAYGFDEGDIELSAGTTPENATPETEETPEFQEKTTKGEAGEGTGGKARRLIKQAEEAGLTHEEIGRATNRAASTIGQIKAGEIENPPDDLIAALEKLVSRKRKDVLTMAEQAVRDELDDLIDALTAKELQTQMEGALESTIKAINNGSSFQDAQSSLAAQFPQMKIEDLERLMQKVVFISEIWGRINV